MGVMTAVTAMTAISPTSQRDGHGSGLDAHQAAEATGDAIPVQPDPIDPLGWEKSRKQAEIRLAFLGSWRLSVGYPGWARGGCDEWE
mgnify:FL=1